MPRADSVLAVVVGALGLFIGVQAARRPRHIEQPKSVSVPAQRDSVAASAPRGAEVSSAQRQSREAAPERDPVDIQNRLTSGSPGTYAPEMLANQGYMLFRWPDRRIDGLRVWVQSAESLPGWSSGYAQMARNAVEDWSGSGVPMRLDFVLDSAGSDIQVQWTERFPPSAGQQIGSTRRTTDQFHWIVGARIVIAIHDSTGRAFSPDELVGIVRHEAGHALGLGHSPDRRTLMFPLDVTHDISDADRSTMRLLYTLPPGSVR